MKGSKIIVTAHPKGSFLECIIVGTPKPGTVMEITPSTEPVGGTFSWQAYGTTAASGGNGVAADGNRKIIAVLTEDTNQARIYSTAYAAGDRGFLYFPLAGEELNMLFENQSGTGDTLYIGQEAMVDDGTGKLLVCDSDAELQPFIVLETTAAMTADTWVHCLCTGGAG